MAKLAERVKIKKKKKIAQIRLKGELSVEDSILLKKKLDKIIDSIDHVEVTFEEVEDIHLSVVQLIVAVKNSLIQKEKKFSMRGTENAAVADILENCGCSYLLN